MSENNKIVFLVKEKLGAIILVGVLVASLSFLALVASQKNFKAGTDFLIIQNQTESQDFYSLFKSAEYVRDILSESVYSELFINEVIKTEKINSEFLPFDKRKRMKEWSRIVKVKGGSQPGIISVEILGDNQKEVLNISESVIEVMLTKNRLFRGEGNIEVKVLSGPIIEKNPGLGDIIMVVTGGFALGFLISLIGIYYKEERDAELYRNTIDKDGEDEEYRDSLKYLED